MLIRFSFLRSRLPPSSPAMASTILRAAATTLSLERSPTTFYIPRSSFNLSPPRRSGRFVVSSTSRSSLFCRRFHALCRGDGRKRLLRPMRFVSASNKDYRKMRGRPAKSKEKQLDLSVSICIEEELPGDPEISSIAELLRLNVPMAMKLAFERITDSNYKTRDNSIQDLGGFESVELSVLLCNDEFIRKLNKEWRDEDHATDVLSMSEHIPELNLPVLMLGDIVISIETAARQAEERGNTLIDEIRILMVHGFLHLLGFDHEISEDAEEEMEEEEEFVLNSLGWKGKGLIRSAYDAETNENLHIENSNEKLTKDKKKEGSLRFYRPKFKCIFCDMDGTLLNSKSQVSLTNARALKEAVSRGVKIVIATGKARPAAISVLQMVNLSGKDGIISEHTPGVFLQGLLVYGINGREIFKRNLDPNVCREAGHYSLEHKVPLVAFCQDRCLTLFNHPLVDTFHTVYHEPKAEIMPSVEHMVAAADIQKLIFFDTAEGIATNLRPYWSKATGDHANVVQAVPDMLEIVPFGTSKGSGVKLLLDHLGVSSKEIMAIGDGENDMEMLELASLGVALSNGSEKTKAVADVIGISNDEDGVADAIYRYAF
ncbi:Haloacid dehalogenase-like hydrolase family protein isoform 2 [Hibiscus syriacus]|uniref:Haloacid dehalogenase-like hydrolase family protein isoform 2 n=1 Tax=Hibiscus syriacus TaxID=106335 RepID=A0A6A2Y4N1_HIBSY|nr:endoribonuclease YBEY, chloroplastic-like [Hibiscus syriacus]KAE8665277.1 Haloacid dehalogenase-like hydrolase family protein isoform 2 [Hibiscus syriacus]